MFHASTVPAAVLPRPAYPEAPRILQTVDRRTRELAEAMNRLNAENAMTGGCTDVLLRLEGFSDHELRTIGPVAQLLANNRFVRQDAVITPEPPSDAMLVAEASALHDELFRSLVIKLRARPDFHEDRLAAIWPLIRKDLALKMASAALPPRLPTNPSVPQGARA